MLPACYAVCSTEDATVEAKVARVVGRVGRPAAAVAMADAPAPAAALAGEPPAAAATAARSAPPEDDVHARLYFLLSPDHDVGIGIRDAPARDAARTGEGVFPGDVVVGTCVREVGGVPYLRLADGSGWVFVTHPTTGIALLQPISEEEATVIIAALEPHDEHVDASGFDEVDDDDNDDDGAPSKKFHTRRELGRLQAGKR